MTQPRMREIEMVYVYDPETDGPDLKRVGERRILPRPEARALVNNGEARYTDEPRDEADRPLADLSRTAVVQHAKTVGVEVDDTMSKSTIIAKVRDKEQEAQVEQQREDLSKLTKDDLRGRLAELRDQGVTVDEPVATAKKDELIAAVEAGMDAARTGGTSNDAAAAAPSVETGDTNEIVVATPDAADDGQPVHTVMPGAGGNPVPDTVPDATP